MERQRDREMKWRGEIDEMRRIRFLGLEFETWNLGLGS